MRIFRFESGGWFRVARRKSGERSSWTKWNAMLCRLLLYSRSKGIHMFFKRRRRAFRMRSVLNVTHAVYRFRSRTPETTVCRRPIVSTTAVSRANPRRASGPRKRRPPSRAATATWTPARPRRTCARCSTSSRKRDGSKTGPSTRCTYFRQNTGKPWTKRLLT